MENIDNTLPPMRHIISDQEMPTLRDRFAMAALQGMLSDTDWEGDTDSFSRFAYLYADAMIAERNKK